jgi:hypothetical protein
MHVRTHTHTHTPHTHTHARTHIHTPHTHTQTHLLISAFSVCLTSFALCSAEPQAFASGGATIADVVELERGLRQLAELGVVQEVLASLMHQRQAAISAQLQVCGVCVCVCLSRFLCIHTLPTPTAVHAAVPAVAAVMCTPHPQPPRITVMCIYLSAVSQDHLLRVIGDTVHVSDISFTCVESVPMRHSCLCCLPIIILQSWRLVKTVHYMDASLSFSFPSVQAGVDGHDPDEFPSLPSRLPSPSTVSTTAMAGSMQQGTGSQAEAGVAQAQGVDEDPRTSNSSSNEICASEAQEVAFQRAWLAYIWSRAASSGVEPHICRDRAEHWGHLLLWGNKALPPSSTASTQQGGISGAPKDSPFAAAALPSQVASGGSPALVHAKELVDVRAGQQELARLGVDLQIWALRAHSLRNFV